eukprot:SAG31_NODE_12870_length_910_cov_1.138101_2_plen_75_part_00
MHLNPRSCRSMLSQLTHQVKKRLVADGLADGEIELHLGAATPGEHLDAAAWNAKMSEPVRCQTLWSFCAAIEAL